MNLIRPSLLVLSLVFAGTAMLCAQSGATPAPAATIAAPASQPAPRVASTGGKSPHETISTVIGDRKTGNRITITYGRPFTRDPKTGNPRKIWGGLVVWDKADRLGADEATLLITQQPLLIGETTIPAGAHTLYIIPSDKNPTKLAFSTALGKWGVPVDETHDLARVELKKDSFEKSVDQLTLAIENNPAGGGTLKIMWENTVYSLPFTVQK